MAPTERFRLPFRFQFVATDESGDGTIRWRWRAFSHAGDLLMQSETMFEELTECEENARRYGYDDR